MSRETNEYNFYFACPNLQNHAFIKDATPINTVTHTFYCPLTKKGVGVNN